MANQDDLPCVHCDGLKEDHHEYEPPKIPEGCVCDVLEWGDPTDIPRVCGSFENMDYEPLCRNCEHEEACHKANGGGL